MIRADIKREGFFGFVGSVLVAWGGLVFGVDIEKITVSIIAVIIYAVLPQHLYLRLYYFLAYLVLQTYLKWIFFQLFKSSLATSLAGNLESRKNYSPDCILSLKFISILLIYDTTDRCFYHQIFGTDVVANAIQLMAWYSLDSSVRPRDSRYVEVISEVANTIKTVLMSCGRMKVDDRSGDVLFLAPISSSLPALRHLIEQLSPVSGPPIPGLPFSGLFKHLLQPLSTLSEGSEAEVMEATKIYSLIRILLEMEQLLIGSDPSTVNPSSERVIAEGFSSSSFIEVYLRLLKKNLSIIGDVKITKDGRTKCLSSLQSLMRVLSLCLPSLEQPRRDSLDSALLDLFIANIATPEYLTYEGFNSLYREITFRNTSHLPKTKDQFDRSTYKARFAIMEVQFTDLELQFATIVGKLAESEKGRKEAVEKLVHIQELEIKLADAESKRIDAENKVGISFKWWLALVLLITVQILLCDNAPAKQLTLTGHSRAVSAIVELADKRIVSASRDYTLRVWDTVTGRCVGLMEGHTSDIKAMILLNDGRLASGGVDNTIIIWRPSSRDLSTPFERETTLIGHSDPVTCLLQLRDGSGMVASGSWDNTIRLWNSKNGQPVRNLTEDAEFVFSLSQFYRDGQWWLLSGSMDETIRIWSLTTSEVKVLSRNSGGVMSMVMLQDGRLASGSDENTVEIWDMNKRDNSITLTGHTGWITSLFETTDGLLLSGSKDGTVKCWDTKKPSVSLWSLSAAGSKDGVESIRELSDGRLVSGGWDKTLKIWKYD